MDKGIGFNYYIPYFLSIKESLDKIFGAVIVGEVDVDNVDRIDIIKGAQICGNRFKVAFPSNIFQDEYAIFHELLVRFNIRWCTWSEMETFLNNNSDIILNSPAVDLSKFAMVKDGITSTDEEKLEAMFVGLKKKLYELSNMYVPEQQFISSCNLFSDWFKQRYMLQTAQNMTLIMSDTGFEEKRYHGRGRTYKGVEDAVSYFRSANAKIEELGDKRAGRSYVIDEAWLKESAERDKQVKGKYICNWGITEIDEVVGDLRRGRMYCFMGPPKGGKTTLSNFVAHRGIMAGMNVAVWAVEGSPDEWESKQLSAICFSSGVPVNSKEIYDNKFKGNKDEVKIKRTAVASARTRLATDPNLGRLSFIEGAAYIEDFMDVIEAHFDNDNQFDIIVVDSLINMLSKNGVGEVQRISEAFVTMKNAILYKFKKQVACVVTAQLKQDVIDIMRKSKDSEFDVTAGAKSAETIRTPDEVIAIFNDRIERKAGVSHLYHVASRHSDSFEPFVVEALLGYSQFRSNPELNK